MAEPTIPDDDAPVARRERRERHRAFAVVAPGLEALTADELGGLGLRSARVTAGGVRFTATTRQLYAANLWLRTATRVVVRVARFEARTFAELEAEVAAVDWAPWFEPGRPVRLRVSSSGSRLHHTGAIAERVHRASGHPAGDVLDATSSLRTPARPDDDLPLVVVRVVHDQVTISVDSSGAPLGHRGWRLDPAKAPLRETLAAALLLAAPWDPTTPLVDPFCGSGTIAIEAALLAEGAAPGRDRSFAFAQWPSFEPGTWASVLGAARRPADATAGSVRIAASDRDAGAVRATLANAERAGVLDALVVEQHAISDLRPAGDGPGLLLTNPPYGTRIGGGGDRRDLFARLGTVARERLPDSRVGLLVDDGAPIRSTGVRFHERLRTSNGGIAVRLLVGRP